MYGDSRIVELAARRGCNGCASARQCLRKTLPVETARQFESGARQVRVLERGEHLFACGDRFRSLYVVRSGSIKMYALSDDGDEQVLGFCLPGEAFGLAQDACFDSVPARPPATAPDAFHVALTHWRHPAPCRARNSSCPTRSRWTEPRQRSART